VKEEDGLHSAFLAKIQGMKLDKLVKRVQNPVMNQDTKREIHLEEALRSTVEGRHLEAGTLGGEIGSDRTLLVFLRHFG
jgi:hypothetical protein